MKKILTNIVCGFVPGKQRRKRARLRLNHPIVKEMAAFAKTFSTSKKPHLEYTYGFRCANFVVTVDKKWVFKFPLRGDAHDVSTREKRITDALRPISPIKIPDMEIILWNNIYVRKYECISGVGFHSLTRNEQNVHATTIAKQLAACLYTIGMADPVEIRDLKPKKSDKPSIMHGWNQNDLWDNFIINPKTFKIVGLIDWEDAAFVDFHQCFTSGTGNDSIKIALLNEYIKIATKK